MRVLPLAIVLFAAPASAFTPRDSERPVVAAGTRQPRLHRDVVYAAPPGVTLGELASWRQIWDADTGVPLRMWGPSLPAFGSIGSPAVAEAAARAFIAEHLGLLAPGAVASDFVVVSNAVDPSGHIRTIGFAQTAGGLRVLGGSIAVTFERDHLVMVSSTALPNVRVVAPKTALAPTMLEASARAFLASDQITTRVTKHGDRVIVPLVYTRGSKRAPDLAYRVAETVTVAADRGPGRWDVWLDATDGAPIARRSRVLFASGTVEFDTPDRYPAGGRSPKPAPNDTHTVNGVQTTSDGAGVVTWPSGDATVTPGLAGPLVAVTNVAGALVTDDLALADGGSVIWSHADDAPADAQLDAFVFASQAKLFVRTRLDPSLPLLDETQGVFVNENDTCNAYSDLDLGIHFYSASAMCENTGRIADVVYHEFGHSVHNNAVLPGVGLFNSSVSEGLADTLAVSITGDHGMARGFYYTSDPLRDVDPVGIEKKWPDDADGEPHDEGEIVGEALYDLRKALQISLGVDAGFAKFLQIYYGEMQRSVDIPSTYPEALVTDDDDGDLSNGTPDECAIDSAFALHGLTTPAETFALVPPTRTNNTVSIAVHPPQHVNPACPITVATATLSWSLRNVSGSGGDIPMVATGETYSADLPAAPDGSVVLYHVTLVFDDTSKVAYPDNRADPDYQMYVGAVTTLQCFDFEAGFEGWTHDGSPAAKDEWEVGAPEGLNGDPSAAYDGTNELGIDLDHDGVYEQSTTQWATSPPIDLQGYTNVHLQYYRWLSVRDNAYDHATIFADTNSVWTNYLSPGARPVGISHIDREWRFHDVDLTSAITPGMPLTLEYSLVSTRGAFLAGWNIDDVCIVGIGVPSLATCGNGVVESGETCDDGNTTDGDGCSATCQTEIAPVHVDGGCCDSGQAGGSGAIALSLATLCCVFRRRRS